MEVDTMDRIAFIMGELFIYWNSIILTLAVAGAICLFLAFYLNKSGNAVAGFAVVPVGMVLSLLLARFIHWYCRADSYNGFLDAMTNYSSGGFALMGVVFGCILAAVITRLLRLQKNLPEMLDCMCIAGAAGIAVGRLASFFNASDRGQIVESIKSLPFVYPVTNAVSGALEYRLATFMIQAMVALVLFIALAVFYLKNKHYKLRDGDVTLIFLLVYGASQVVLDSTRYDSLFFRSNGFVSIVQVLGALAIGFPIILFSVRLVLRRGWKNWYPVLWLVTAALLGLGGYMEYHVQRHAAQAVFAYSVMTACLIGLVAMGVLIRALASVKNKTGKISRT